MSASPSVARTSAETIHGPFKAEVIHRGGPNGSMTRSWRRTLYRQSKHQTACSVTDEGALGSEGHEVRIAYHHREGPIPSDVLIARLAQGAANA
jgi:hypothetical protein